MEYYRPIASVDPSRPAGALPLAGGWCWFSQVEVLRRDAPPEVVPVSALPAEVRERLSAPRAAFGGLRMDVPQVMGILNVTPDSFSDGGRFLAPEAALAQAQAMAEGADVLDIGGESTRPGAAEVPVAEEVERTAPVIAALRAGGMTVPISVDTRKAGVARAALAAGAGIVNDVAAMGFDPEMASVVAGSGAPVILMHSIKTPATMQDDPRYDDVLLDVYDFLKARIAAAVAAGIARERIMVDPGIGFGKTAEHNLALVRRLSLFHDLGVPVLLGVSRKRFIGNIGGEPVAERRVAGSVAVALAGVAQGAQVVRVHDVAETRQALRLWQAVNGVAG
ncbi:dihydropteroate synthase [Rhodobacteraceae bacterium HSP-20]|uniref:Dihydropteroate synthase n=1 Tax=Paragemmobacter amnigenus TaxID=2852097 RepID=A0ABS6IZC0_9RHOB|nr:dihydropteroate synthase [Rhodobacter amnigenus]MBU9696859.1 dihydropteroate synthase [Rhodobacter amnigenus]MBV4388086.1 dihydropteroate synthase [Rhodobacter amnigenus]